MKNLNALLETISTERLGFVHSIFMNIFMDFDNYVFRDEWMSNRYLDHFKDGLFLYRKDARYLM